MSPEETLQRVRACMPAMGITRIANLTGLDCIGIPVVMVCRPNSRSLAVSQGKGADLMAARASGLMESIEFYHAERLQHPLKLGTFAELCDSHTIVDVGGLPHLKTTRFHADLPILWIEGQDLLNERSAWVPYEMLQLNMTLPAPTGTGCFLGGSNGLASGNHWLEAVSHAICEVVERDASTLFDVLDAPGQMERRLDLTTVDDELCLEVLERYARASIAVAAWDMTTDVGIPAFLCEIVDDADDPLRALYPCAGMGCHPRRSIALLRALTEAAQERMAHIAGTRDDLFRAEYERARSQDLLRRHRATLRDRGTRDFRAVITWDAETLDDDVRWELDRLRAAGIREAVAIDLTRAEFAIPVVHVSIPGLEAASWVDEYSPGRRARTVLGSVA